MIFWVTTLSVAKNGRPDDFGQPGAPLWRYVRRLLVLAERLSVPEIPQVQQRRVVDVLTDEPHRAVTQQKMAAAGMGAACRGPIGQPARLVRSRISGIREHVDAG